METCASPPIQVNEDVAIMILAYLANGYYHGPSAHWMRIRGVSKAFNGAVLRYASKTTAIGLEDAISRKNLHSVKIFQCIVFGERKHCTQTLFEDSNAAVAHLRQACFNRYHVKTECQITVSYAFKYFRCIASHVDRPIAIHLEDYADHSAEDELLKSLCSFRAIESISHIRPRCKCAACKSLVKHAGPHVKLETISPVASDTDGDPYDNGYPVPPFYSSDDSDDHDDDFYFREDDY